MVGFWSVSLNLDALDQISIPIEAGQHLKSAVLFFDFVHNRL